MNKLSIDIPGALVTYVGPALARLGYLHPDVEWSFKADGRRLEARYAPEAHEADSLRKEAFFQIYREKIQHDTLGIRNRIYEAIEP